MDEQLTVKIMSVFQCLTYQTKTYEIAVSATCFQSVLADILVFDVVAC